MMEPEYRTEAELAFLRARFAGYLKRTSAPRFLLPLLTAPEGVYELDIDDETLHKKDRTGTLIVEFFPETGARNAVISYVHRHDHLLCPEDMELIPVYRFYHVRGSYIGMGHSFDGFPPDISTECQTMDSLINDDDFLREFCEWCSLPMARHKQCTEPPLLIPAA